MTNGGTWNLFAILDGEEIEIRRISLEQTIQEDLRRLFDAQYRDLTSQDPEEVPFDPSLTPDESEIFAIPNFACPEPILDAVRNPLSVHVLDQSEDHLESVKGIFLGNGELAKLLFQTFDRRQILSRKRFTLIPSGNTFGRLSQEGLSLDNKLAAVLMDGRLLFRSYYIVRRFLDLTEYFKGATDSDLDDFAASTTLSVDRDTLDQNADSWVRKKIALIQQSNVLRTVPARTIVSIAGRYGIEISLDSTGSKLEIPSDKRVLKQVLRLLDESYFTADLTHGRYISNSKRKL